MSHDEYTILLKYMEENFDNLNTHFDKFTTKADLNILQSRVDSLIKNLTEHHLEIQTILHNDNRLDPTH